jgi:exopolyphosphatase / guanosine-5'-triphosphate,3'-diphosphate pyrophosphatase
VNLLMPKLFAAAPLRPEVKGPVAVVDIGSNSVRLVAYDGLTRAPTPIFNEKSLCALGHGVANTGELSASSMAKALAALRRYKTLIRIMNVQQVYAFATAAARDAGNGPAFVAEASEAVGAPVSLLSGKREAELSALGVISGFHEPDGVVADLGGGSLELIDIKGTKVGKGITLPLGGLSLMDASNQSLRIATRIAQEALENAKLLSKLRGRTLYAVGGTWRALAKLHMRQRNYLLSIMHGYNIPAREAADFAGLVERVNAEALIAVESVTPARRPLLAYGAIVLDEIIRKAQPKQVTISASGVREGLLYEQLSSAEQRLDPLIFAAQVFNDTYSRSPRHAEDLRYWTDNFMASLRLEETAEDKRLRHAACLLADVNWRAHPDYRSEQSLNIVVNGAFLGIDHPGRCFLALTMSYRYLGLDADVNPQIRAHVSPRMLDRARLLAGTMRVAYVISAGMADVLPKAPLLAARGKLSLTLPAELSDLASERLSNRLKQLGRLVGREPTIQSGAEAKTNNGAIAAI